MRSRRLRLRGLGRWWRAVRRFGQPRRRRSGKSVRIRRVIKKSLRGRPARDRNPTLLLQRALCLLPPEQALLARANSLLKDRDISGARLCLNAHSRPAAAARHSNSPRPMIPGSSPAGEFTGSEAIGQRHKRCTCAPTTAGSWRRRTGSHQFGRGAHRPPNGWASVVERREVPERCRHSDACPG